MKIIVFALLFFITFFRAEALEVENVTTDLSVDKPIVKVIGEGFEKECSIKYMGTDIPTTSISEKIITFDYSNIKGSDGTFDLKCPSNSKKITYSFPEITNVKVSNESPLNLYISGNNFKTFPTVSVKGSSIEYLGRGNNDISIKLSKNSKPEELYVSVNGSKSNKIILEKVYPIINYVEAKNGFMYPNNVKVCGENFNDSDDISFGKKVISSNNYKLSDGCFTFQMPSVSEYNPTIKVYNEYFTSNSVGIKIKQNYPKLAFIRETSYYDKLRSETISAFALKGDNFSEEISKNTVHINGRQVKVYNAKKDQLIVKKDNLLPGINFIYVSVNGNPSNYITYNNEFLDFRITNVEFLDNTSDKGTKFKISFLGKIDSEDYKFNINRKDILPTNCFKSGYCEIYYKGNDIDKLEIYLTFKGRKITNSYYYGKTKYDEAPYVSHIEFPEGLGATNRILVHGEFLQNATSISTSNLFNKDNLNKDDYKLDGKRLTGAFLPTYKDGSSSISVRSNFGGISNSFSKVDIVDNVVYFPPYISNISTKDISFKPGTKVRIDGKGFSTEDVLIIDKKEIKMSTIDGLDYYGFTFNLPSDIAYGDIQIKVRKGEKKFSNIYKIYVQSPEFNDKIFVKNDSSFKQSDFFKDNKKNQVISKYLITNNIAPVVMNEIKLKVLPVEHYRGTFFISINGRKYGPEVLDTNGEATFKDILLPFSSRDIAMEIIKESSFIYTGKHSAQIDFSDTVFYFTKTGEKKYNLIDTDSITKFYYVNSVFDKRCYTNDDKNFCLNDNNQNVIRIEDDFSSDEPTDEVTNPSDVNDSDESDFSGDSIFDSERIQKENKIRNLVIDFMPKYDNFIEKKSKGKQANKDFLNAYYYNDLLKLKPKVEGKFPHNILIDQLIIELEKRQK